MVATLIFNAVEAMPEGGEIALQTQGEGDFVLLSFSDTGIGMEEQLRRRVFEPFFTTKMDVGSGLGLSALHGTLTEWGGRVEVESTPGQGTTFALYFPVWSE
jgi:signal transduction histidine kinase